MLHLKLPPCKDQILLVMLYFDEVFILYPLLLACSAWDDPEFVEAVLRLVLSRLVDSQLGIFAMLNFAISIYAVGALTTKVCSEAVGLQAVQAVLLQLVWLPLVPHHVLTCSLVHSL